MKLSSLPWKPILEGEITSREWFQYAQKIGLDGVELMDGWLNTHGLNLDGVDCPVSKLSETVFETAVVQRFKHEIAESGHKVSMLTIHNRFCRFSPEDQQEEVERLRVCMDVARSFGTDRLRVIAEGWPVEGKEIPYREAMEACIDTIWRCVETASQEGLYLLLENHPGLSVDIEGYAEILSRVDSPYFGANLDCKNTRRAGKDPTEFLEREEIRSRLLCLHIDNYVDTPQGWDRSVSVDEGDVDIRAVLRMLKGYGYVGWLSIEYGGLGIEKVERSAEFIRKVWEE